MFADANIIKQGNNLYVQHGDDSGLYVEFSMEAVENTEKSQEQGRPVFEEKNILQSVLRRHKNSSQASSSIRVVWKHTAR